jgi:hypothetical protein
MVGTGLWASTGQCRRPCNQGRRKVQWRPDEAQPACESYVVGGATAGQRWPRGLIPAATAGGSAVSSVSPVTIATT